MKKTRQQILSAVLALCLCISSPAAVHAWQEDFMRQESVHTEKTTSEPVTYDSTIPAPTEIYESMIALKEQDAYKEGTKWTDYEPYSGSGYHWKGGTLDGKTISAVGCVAFAFLLSDAAFGSLPARMYAEGGFSFEDIKTGDILRVNNDTHTVIVLEVSDVGVVIAEGNYSGTVHWGRTLSKEEVMRNASHYITRYPEGYVSPDDPDANLSIAKGTLDGGLTWNLTKAGTMTVSGKGAMPDFSSTQDQPWSDNSSKIRKVVIENGVTNIGSCAFWKCGVLSAEIPASVTTIGNSAFRESSIISVAIPSGVTVIGDSAFRSCQNLSSVTFSEGLRTIVQNAFRSCTSLTAVNLPASIEEVGAGTFFQCTAMTSAVFAPGSGQVKLGDNLFTQCYYLMSVTLPKNIDRIGEGMFQNCQMLAGVEIPQGAESIGGSAFASSAVKVVIIPDSVTTIGIAAFSSCSLTDIYFTGTEAQWNSISKIGDTAAAVSKAAVHYNYVPVTKPDPDAGDNTPGGGDNSGSGDDSGNGGNSGNGDDSSNGGDTEPGKNPSGDEGAEPGDNSGGSGNGESGESETPLAKDQTFTVDKVTYKVTKAGEEVELTTSKSTAKKVTVDTITGTDGVKYKITSIGAKAMQNNKKMTSLTIGASVKKIGKSAFKGCKKLGKVTIKSTKLSSVGKGAFKGTKTGLKVKVPSKQLKKYKKAFKKAGLKAEQIVK